MDAQHTHVMGNQVRTVALVDFYTGLPVDGSTNGGGTSSTAVPPTEPFNSTLVAGVTVTSTNMQSLVLVNDESSTGNISITSAGSTVVLMPGESVGWEAASGGTLTTLTITLPVGTTGRMFGTRAITV
jgi:hypothetical protein